MTTKQRVNIQYSVGVDEVPQLLVSLLNEAIAKLEEAANDATSTYPELRKQSLEYENHGYGIKEIDTIRTALADIDYRLADCGQMLAGLRDLKEPSPQTTSVAADKINQAATAAAATAEFMGNTENEG